jgi:hypothetical protein
MNASRITVEELFLTVSTAVRTVDYFSIVQFICHSALPLSCYGWAVSYTADNPHADDFLKYGRMLCSSSSKL